KLVILNIQVVMQRVFDDVFVVGPVFVLELVLRVFKEHTSVGIEELFGRGEARPVGAVEDGAKIDPIAEIFRKLGFSKHHPLEEIPVGKMFANLCVVFGVGIALTGLVKQPVDGAPMSVAIANRDKRIRTSAHAIED